jgi:hypothetical protein
LGLGFRGGSVGVGPFGGFFAPPVCVDCGFVGDSDV